MSGNCLQCIFSCRKRVCLSRRAVWKLSVQSTYLKSVFLPGACSCTKSFQAHQLETASYPCCGMATDKICPQLDKDMAVALLLGTTCHLVPLRAFPDFLCQVILWWFSPEDTQPPRQQQEPSAHHVHPQPGYPPSPSPCQPWGLADGTAGPTRWHSATGWGTAAQRAGGCFWAELALPPNGNLLLISILFTCRALFSRWAKTVPARFCENLQGKQGWKMMHHENPGDLCFEKP